MVVDNKIKYAIYSNDVKEKDKYKVSNLPTKFFKSKQSAKSYIRGFLLTSKNMKMSDFKIYKVDEMKVRGLW